MKITYPECQIEISTEEIINLLDYFREIKPSTEVKIERKELEEMMNQHFVERTSSRKHENPKEPDNHEEDPAPTFEPGGFVPEDEQPAPKPYPAQEEHTPVEIPKERKHDSTKKASNKKKKVEVKLDNGEWRTFNSISRAATYIGMSMTGLSNALIRGTKAFGHEVRYASDNNEQTQPANEEQTELP